MNGKWSRVCCICNESFTTNRAHQQTCSLVCRQKRNKAYQVKNPQTSLLRMRFELLQRDDFRCQYCGRTPQDKVVLIMEHILPASKGGATSSENLITACTECNAGKSDVLLTARHSQRFTTLTKGHYEYNQRFEKKWKDQMEYIERNRS